MLCQDERHVCKSHRRGMCGTFYLCMFHVHLVRAVFTVTYSSSSEVLLLCSMKYRYCTRFARRRPRVGCLCEKRRVLRDTSGTLVEGSPPLQQDQLCLLSGGIGLVTLLQDLIRKRNNRLRTFPCPNRGQSHFQLNDPIYIDCRPPNQIESKRRHSSISSLYPNLRAQRSTVYANIAAGQHFRPSHLHHSPLIATAASIFTAVLKCHQRS